MATNNNTSSAANTITASKVGGEIPSPVAHLSFMTTQFCLRILAAAMALTAACLMFTSKQSKLLFGTVLEARYTYSSAFKFFTFVNVVACVLSLLSLFPVFSLGRKFSNSINYYFLFLHDLALTVLLMAGCSAATAIGLVGKYGMTNSGWLPICGNFGRFCHKAGSAIIVSYLAAFCYLFLTIISAQKSRQIPV